MTGYGRFEDTINDYKILIEIKTVNHRYFEFSPKLPRDLSFIEIELKLLVNSYISRGKIELYIKLESLKQEKQIVVDNRVIAQYINTLRSLTETFNLKDDLSLSNISNLPDVFKFEQQSINQQLVQETILFSVKNALLNHMEMREIEGEKIKIDILNKVDYIQKNIKDINELSNQTVDIFKQKLYDKLSEILKEKDTNDNRVLTEIAIISEKLANDEELVRLDSHISQLKQIMNSQEPIGRKLDFLIQEINREINTIGSKSQNVNISKIVVELKTTVEKIREQIQNIE